MSTTGSFWNRFANAITLEEINRFSREVLIKTKDIVQGLRLGFELVYVDTDSVFLKSDHSLEILKTQTKYSEEKLASQFP